VTVTPITIDPAVEVHIAAQRIAEATAAYIVRLKGIVGSLDTLTTAAHGFDFAVTVDHADKLRILPLLAELTFDIETEFGVGIRTFAISGSSHPR
jgi:hypothetical protein